MNKDTEKEKEQGYPEEEKLEEKERTNGSRKKANPRSIHVEIF